MNMHTKRRKRRRANQLAKIGSGLRPSVRKHARIGGRTGSIMAKKNHGKAAAHYINHYPNPSVEIASLGGPLF